MTDNNERYMVVVCTITQTMIDSGGYLGKMNSPARSLGLQIRGLVGRFHQCDLGRRVYRGKGGRLVLAGSSPFAPDIRV